MAYSLGREDSNLCISKSDLPNFIVAQPDLGRLTPETFLRSAACSRACPYAELQGP